MMRTSHWTYPDSSTTTSSSSNCSTGNSGSSGSSVQVITRDRASGDSVIKYHNLMGENNSEYNEPLFALRSGSE